MTFDMILTCGIMKSVLVIQQLMQGRESDYVTVQIDIIAVLSSSF